MEPASNRARGVIYLLTALEILEKAAWRCKQEDIRTPEVFEALERSQIKRTIAEEVTLATTPPV
jgi:hypothetical protein